LLLFMGAASAQTVHQPAGRGRQERDLLLFMGLPAPRQRTNPRDAGGKKRYLQLFMRLPAPRPRTNPRDAGGKSDICSYLYGCQHPGCAPTRGTREARAIFAAIYGVVGTQAAHQPAGRGRQEPYLLLFMRSPAPRQRTNPRDAGGKSDICCYLWGLPAPRPCTNPRDAGGKSEICCYLWGCQHPGSAPTRGTREARSDICSYL
jgi:hypothetical protein